MKAEACRRCIEAAQAAGEIVAFLNDPPAKCTTCEGAAVMRTVSEQFKIRAPRWWVVNRVVVVPIWIVELIKHRNKFGEGPVMNPQDRQRSTSSDADYETKKQDRAAGCDAN